jgi:hypothetical protein
MLLVSDLNFITFAFCGGKRRQLPYRMERDRTGTFPHLYGLRLRLRIEAGKNIFRETGESKACIKEGHCGKVTVEGLP